MRFSRRPIAPYLLLTAVFLLQWLLLFTTGGPTWDAVSYYVYARSAVFDGDLDFANDYALSYPTAGEPFAAKGFDQITTVTGRVENIFSIGPALLWLPWLAILRLGAIGGLGAGAAASGYEPYYTGSVALLSAVIGLLAFMLSYAVAASDVGRRPAIAAAITLMFTTPLLYYQFREPMYSHTASAFAIALCVFVWWKQMQALRFTLWQGLALGAAIGFAGLVRYQNLIYLALPAVGLLIAGLSMTAEQRKTALRDALIYLVGVAAGAIILFALQMSIWRVLFGTFFTIPFVEGTDLVDWRAFYLDELLFSSFRGLLPWMPVFFLAIVGLLGLARRKPSLAWPLLLMLLLAVYINGSTRDWFGGGGYGPRRLTSELSILVVGYAAFLRLVPKRVRGWVALLIGSLLAFHQWVLLRYGLVEQLGGRVRSMVPTFEWVDQPLADFFADLGRFGVRGLMDPLDFLVFSGSPLDQLLRRQTWPASQMNSLLLVVLAALLLWLLWRLITRRKMQQPLHWVTAVSLLLFVALAHIWILTLA